jgi:hypothetical protein
MHSNSACRTGVVMQSESEINNVHQVQIWQIERVKFFDEDILTLVNDE